MSDYERVARVIHYLVEHRAEQPRLSALAAEAGLSLSHFHRLFSVWAGITPKDFLQCLTLVQVKQRLREGESVLNAALATGLSGPGRLHDLCISLEAASPGEVKSGGHGWIISFGFADTPFGVCIVGEGPRGICHLAFVEGQDRLGAEADLCAAWPAAQWTRNDLAATQLVSKIFCLSPTANHRPRLRAFVKGTKFQVRVWQALLRVPPGSLVTYGRLADAIGQPTASRAVGTAVGQNPLAYLIPCHRVIRQTGVLGGYRWGQVRKQAMIAWEGASSASQPTA
jgi:AraC family transcriptional regulator, regulatory protein of adaptative response / methylated-DNA-[protein]-cysteine methyltransferase